MRKRKYISILICLILSVFAISCKNAFFTDKTENEKNTEMATVRFSAASLARTIQPDVSQDRVEQLTNIKISIDYDQDYFWSSYSDLANDESEIEISIGKHHFEVEAHIGTILYRDYKDINIVAGTNYITFELKPGQIEKPENTTFCDVDLTVYFPAMTGNLEGKLYTKNSKYSFATVTDIYTCTDESSEHFGMMYFNYTGKMEASEKANLLKVIVEDSSYTQNIAAYYTDYFYVATEHTTRSQITIPKLIEVHHAFYIDSTNKDGSLHYMYVNTFTDTVDGPFEVLTEIFDKMYISDTNFHLEFQNTPEIKANGNYYFYSKNYEKQTITVSFVTNCDKQIEPIEISAGSLHIYSDEISAPAGTYKFYNLADYDLGFEGWYYDAEFTESVKYSKTITEDFTLYAKFDDIITLSIETNSQEGVKAFDSKKFIKGATLRLSPDVGGRRDYKPYLTISTSAKNYSYRLAFADYFWSDDFPVDFWLIKEGFYPEGFYFDKDFTNPMVVDTSYELNEDTAIYVKWVDDSDFVNISFEDNLNNIDYDSEIFFPKDKDKKIHREYSPLSFPKGSSLEVFVISGNIIGLGDTGVLNTRTGQAKAFSMSRGLADSFFFIGLFFDKEFTISADSFVADNDVTIYAKWRDTTKYKVSFETNCGIEIDPIYIYDDEQYFVEPTCIIGRNTRAQYDYKNEEFKNYLNENRKFFDGWFFDKDFTQLATEYWSHSGGELGTGASVISANYKPVEIKQDITLYAKWAEPVVINFELNNGKSVEPITVGKGHSVSINASTNYRTEMFCLSARESNAQMGYSSDDYILTNDITEDEWKYFAGWYYDKDFTLLAGDSIDSITINPESDITLYAKWFELVTISIVTNCERTIEPIHVIKGSNVKIKCYRGYFGYREDGTVSESVPSIDFSGAIDNGLLSVGYDSLFKKYKPASGIESLYKNYNLSFELDDVYNPYIDDLYKDEKYEEKLPDTEQVNEDMTLYLKWFEPITVNFVTNCETQLDSITIPSNPDMEYDISDNKIQEYDAFPRKPFDICQNPLTKEGYIFDLWYFDQEFTQPAQGKEYDDKGYLRDRRVHLTENTTLYAKWSESKTVTFETLGLIDLEPITIAKGHSLKISFAQYNRILYICDENNIANTRTYIVNDLDIKEIYNDSHYGGFYYDGSDEIFKEDFSFEVNDDTTVYLKWKDLLTISFDTGGRESLEPMIVEKGVEYKYRQSNTTNGNPWFIKFTDSDNKVLIYRSSSFDGLYYDSEFTNPVAPEGNENEHVVFLEDTTLYLKYKEE